MMHNYSENVQKGFFFAILWVATTPPARQIGNFSAPGSRGTARLETGFEKEASL